MGYIVGGYILVVLITAFVKKIKAYDAFLIGIKDGITTVINMFSTLLSFVLIVESIKACGVIDDIGNLFNANIIIQSIIRPLSASSSMAILIDIFNSFGVDSNEAILSTFIHTTIDTTFYIIVLYFSSCGIKNYRYAFIMGLIIIIIAYLLIYIFMVMVI
jgi:spore maturation protein B